MNNNQGGPNDQGSNGCRGLAEGLMWGLLLASPSSSKKTNSTSSSDDGAQGLGLLALLGAAGIGIFFEKFPYITTAAIASLGVGAYCVGKHIEKKKPIASLGFKIGGVVTIGSLAFFPFKSLATSGVYDAYGKLAASRSPLEWVIDHPADSAFFGGVAALGALLSRGSYALIKKANNNIPGSKFIAAITPLTVGATALSYMLYQDDVSRQVLLASTALASSVAWADVSNALRKQGRKVVGSVGLVAAGVVMAASLNALAGDSIKKQDWVQDGAAVIKSWQKEEPPKKLDVSALPSLKLG